MKKRQYTEILNRQEGSVMLVALMVMAALSILGINALNISTTELQITSNVQNKKMAFYNADAGVQYTLACIENDLKDSDKETSEVLPASVEEKDATDSSCGVPTGFNFSISKIRMVVGTTDQYYFTSTGNAQGNAQVEIKVVFMQDESKPFTFAAFGDKSMEVKNSGTTESYDSADPDPTKNDPNDPGFVKTGEADIGSNEDLITKTSAMIDGDGVVGKTSVGVQGVSDIKSGSVFTGSAPVLQDRVDPDPLGVTSGGVYDPTQYSVSNDNATYGAITTSSGKKTSTSSLSTSITTKSGDTVTLTGKPGGSNFYFTSVDLKNGVDLDIDTSLGPVNIFLDEGPFNAKNSSITNSNGKTTDFSIYSNGTDDITMHHGSAFAGVIYAPYAFIDMKNSSTVYGAIWGSDVLIHNSGNLFYDEALKDKYVLSASSDVMLMSWEEQ